MWRKIASISGRYYAMDRDKRWERVQKAFDAVVCAEPCSSLSADEFMQASYDNDVTDEFVVPGALDARGVLDGVRSCSLTSAPTALAKSRVRLSMPISTALCVRARPKVSFCA